MDRSPVRRTGTDYLVVNVTYAALVYAQDLIDSGRNQEALEMLAWAENFEKKTELGPKMAERIAQLRVQAQGKDE
jgi:predicted negative regulator of RcsB-dependent stress response